MRSFLRFLAALALASLFAGPAAATCSGVFLPGAACANFGGGSAIPGPFVLGTNVPAWLLAPTSANLAAAVTDKTGTPGSLVFSISPALTGFPTAPTQTPSDTSTDIATDKFVNENLVVALPTLASTGIYGGTGVAGAAAAFTEAANTILGNATSGIAAPTALAVTSCSTSASALLYTTNTGFLCNTAVNAAQLAGATWASPPVTGFGSATPEPVAATNFGWTGTASGKAIKANSATTVASTTEPNSTLAYKMLGLAGSITPSSSGNVLIMISGTISGVTSTTVNNGINLKISYGTGAAPPANGALAGTQVGGVVTWTNPTAIASAADLNVPFSISYVVTGLSLGTTYWIDIAAVSITTTSAVQLVNVAVVAFEQ